MPELPEIETIKNQLKPHLLGKTIKQVKVLRPSMFYGDKNKVKNKKIKKISRRAKMLILHLKKTYLVIHLKMSGQLFFKKKDEKNKTKNKILPSKHTRIIFKFKDKSKLFFNDIRTFGWIKVLNRKNLKNYFSKFGPEPLKKDFTFSYLKKIFSQTQRKIKQVLLDQAKIAGIGNIYSNEALFLADINPKTKANKLKDKQIKKLHQSIQKVLKKAIKLQGSTAKDKGYKLPSGEYGRYQDHFLVYQREDKPCFKCKTKIKRLKLGGRSSFFCPNCQK
jgi:formamidopyrimidine-DNA glycosylase